MKSLKNIFLFSSLLLLSMILTSCITASKSQEQSANLPQEESAPPEEIKTVTSPEQPISLPVRYQTPAYVVNKEDTIDLEIDDESKPKVGARISSTQGPMPLWKIIKPLADLKSMSVSWAQDVAKDTPVDVDIHPEDTLEDALNNLLTQLGYYVEIEGTTIHVNHKVTKNYLIAMPFLSQMYSTDTGGDIIGGSEETNSLKAQISLSSTGTAIGTGDSETNAFDVWANIEENLKVILNIVEISGESSSEYEREYGTAASVELAKAERDGKNTSRTNIDGTAREDSSTAGKTKRQQTTTKRQIAKDGSYFLIDKPVGLITITTTKAMHKRVASYINNLKSSIYKQISIEAKIIEVHLEDSSSIGINWTSILKDFNLTGLVEFGTGGLLGQVYPFTYSNDQVVGDKTYSADGTSYTHTINPGQFVSKISLMPSTFDIFLNALNEQGDTKILSNPKISVLNGQPAFITVGRNTTYIDKIESNITTGAGSNLVTFDVTTERILSGVGMALTATVLDDDYIIMNLVPITSELQEPIEYRDIGSDGAEIGLPIINVREMSTTVKVKDGEMLVIGGLISDVEHTKGEFAPILGDIPLLKYLFGHEEKVKKKRELIILLRPRII